MTAIHQMGVAALGAALDNGAYSSVKATKQMNAPIADNNQHSAELATDAEAALAAAAEAAQTTQGAPR